MQKQIYDYVSNNVALRMLLNPLRLVCGMQYMPEAQTKERIQILQGINYKYYKIPVCSVNYCYCNFKALYAWDEEKQVCCVPRI